MVYFKPDGSKKPLLILKAYNAVCLMFLFLYDKQRSKTNGAGNERE